jgi:hypothetical protein
MVILAMTDGYRVYVENMTSCLDPNTILMTYVSITNMDGEIMGRHGYTPV